MLRLFAPLCLLVPSPAVALAGGTPKTINEICIDQTSADDDELFELYRGPGKANMPIFDGTHCVAGPMSRMRPILMTGSGSVSRAITNSEMGSPGPGDARFFQFFYRDCIAGSAANTSDALAVVFAP